VVAAGWDRRVNIYADSLDDLRQIQQPQPHWPDDVVSFAYCLSFMSYVVSQ